MNRRAGLRTLLLGVALLAMGGCDDSTSPDDLGTVIGRVVAANGVTPIPTASVYIQSMGPATAALTNYNGDYVLENVPPGLHTVVAEKGNFRSETQVLVKPAWTVLSPNVTLTAVGALAYVDGLYDSIEDLIDELGYTATPLTLNDLSQSAALSQYRMIFLNCGAGVPPTAAASLLAWVQQGGTLYASDWELDIVQAMFPQDIITVSSAPEQNVTGTIVEPALEQFMGKNTVQIAYDLPAWKTLSQISATPTVLVRGTITTDDNVTEDQPLALVINYGAGRVVYTTFHNEAGVTSDQLVALRYFIFY
ncbi:MAG TPA: carboxypeptidase regulatory-like domain-containing protein [Gemmatimonadaceae bacterium]